MHPRAMRGEEEESEKLGGGGALWAKPLGEGDSLAPNSVMFVKATWSACACI